MKPVPPPPVPRKLERSNWIAGIVAAVVAVAALVVATLQLLQPSTGTAANISGNSAPVVVTQGSPGANVYVNVPPPRRPSDQDNCAEQERWVGMTPNIAEWSGQVNAETAVSSILYGELRWSPEVNGRKASSNGQVLLEVDAKRTTVYEWNSPQEITHTFAVPIGQYLTGTSGKYRIRWRYNSGTSGVCVVRSEVGI